MIELLTLAVAIGIGLYGVHRQHHTHQAEQTLLRDLRGKRPRPLLCRIPGGHVSAQAIGSQQALLEKTKFIITITPHEITLHPLPITDQPPVDFTPGQLRWFGRPEKYGAYHNDLWLHFERGGMWVLVQLHLPYTETQRVVRTLKQITSEPLVKAYRRQRPYIHAGPTAAYTAHQDLYGAWLLDQPVLLYVMPAHLVVFVHDVVSRTFPMESITHVQVLQRMDGPGSILSFQSNGETFSFAFEAKAKEFATALSQAASRWLEEPLEILARKRKDK